MKYNYALGLGSHQANLFVCSFYTKPSDGAISAIEYRNLTVRTVHKRLEYS